VPKDGPSAGIAMFTALASLFTDTPVRATVAMTGELTLRGLVLPIGGLKEKTLAAMRAGIEHVVIPKLNEKDLADLPTELKQTLKFTLVETVDEVLAVALEPKANGGSGITSDENVETETERNPAHRESALT
jgi:ATP-dependent Lon protease